MSPSDTVYDRMKRTGYLMGSKHRMGPSMESSAAPPSGDAEDESSAAPPNLRDAGDSMESCADCVHFEPASAAAGAAVGPRGNAIGGRAVEGSSCSKYGGYPVTPNQVCDDWEPVAEEGESPGEEPSEKIGA